MHNAAFLPHDHQHVSCCSILGLRLTGAVALGEMAKGPGAGAVASGEGGGGGLTALGLGELRTSGRAVTCTVPRLGGNLIAPIPDDAAPLSSPCIMLKAVTTTMQASVHIFGLQTR